MKRYTITAIKKDGLRQLAFDNNGRCNYETLEQAETQLKNVLENNNQDDIINHVGKDLKVMPVDCYSSGDAKRIYF